MSTGRVCLIGRVRDKLLEAGYEEWPSFSWAPKHEWRWLEKRERRNMVYESF